METFACRRDFCGLVDQCLNIQLLPIFKKLVIVLLDPLLKYFAHTHLLIGHRYPAANAALESTDYLTRLDAYTFHEGFAHLLSYQATEIDCVDWHTPQLTEVAAASRAKLRLALTETDTDRQKQFLEEAVCGSYYEKFACMCGMLYLADRWETQGIDGLQSAFADYHGFAQRALSIRI